MANEPGKRQSLFETRDSVDRTLDIEDLDDSRDDHGSGSPAAEVETLAKAPVAEGAPDANSRASDHHQPIQRDEAGKIKNESMRVAWQHFLAKRPLQDEAHGCPLVFELEADGKTVVCDPVTGKPKSTWKSIRCVW